MHAVWKFLLDEEFLHIYTYGIVMWSLDGIEWRVYPRILTYSADYPEKYAFYICLSITSLTALLGCYLPLFTIRAVSLSALSNASNKARSCRSHCQCKDSDQPSTQASGHHRTGQNSSERYLWTGDAHQWCICSVIIEAYINCSDVGKSRSLCILSQVL